MAEIDLRELLAGVYQHPEGPWSEDDRAWLQANPALDVRVRAPYPGELGRLFDSPDPRRPSFGALYSNAARVFRQRDAGLVLRVVVLRARGPAFLRVVGLAPDGDDARTFLVAPTTQRRLEPASLLPLLREAVRVTFPELRAWPMPVEACGGCGRPFGSSDLCAGCDGAALCLPCALPWMRAHEALPTMFGLVIHGPADTSEDALRQWRRRAAFVQVLEGTPDRDRAIELVEHHLANGGLSS